MEEQGEYLLYIQKREKERLREAKRVRKKEGGEQREESRKKTFTT